MSNLIGRATSKACYWLCEALDGHTERSTTRAKLSASSAVAAVGMLDMKAALNRDALPMQIRATLSAFSGEEWQEVLAVARDETQFIEDELRLPEFVQLRRPGSDHQSRPSR